MRLCGRKKTRIFMKKTKNLNIERNKTDKENKQFEKNYTLFDLISVIVVDLITELQNRTELITESKGENNSNIKDNNSFSFNELVYLPPETTVITYFHVKISSLQELVRSVVACA